MDSFYSLRINNGIVYLASADSNLEIKPGDFCIFKKDFYLDYAKVVKIFEQPPTTQINAPSLQTSAPANNNAVEYDEEQDVSENTQKNNFVSIQRKASQEDAKIVIENLQRAEQALVTTKRFVVQLKLPMKLINAHFSYDGKLLIIQFSAEGRVDFRELLKCLTKEFETHIELRQIGVRDETSALGGIANCGQPLCCWRFISEFASINVKMAKEQDLSLTPATISGVCGRLKCCLKYEHEAYLELEKTMPRRGDICDCKEGRGRVVDRNLLTQMVTVQLDEASHNVVCPVSEISVVYLEHFKSQKNASQKNDDGQSVSSGVKVPQKKQFSQQNANRSLGMGFQNGNSENTMQNAPKDKVPNNNEIALSHKSKHR